MESFSVLGVSGEIDDSAGVVNITVPEGTNMTNVSPTVTVASGCTVSPVSGEVVDLTASTVYTVTNGTDTAYYTVIVTFEKTLSQQLWEKMADDNTITDHQVNKN